MDAFEENVQTFSGTIHGKEMKDSMIACFNLLRTEVDFYGSKIDGIRKKIIELEEK